MTKSRKWKWLIALVLVLALVVGAGAAVALNPSFQTSMALSALKKSDPDAALERVAIGLGGGEVRGLKLRLASGQQIALDEATARFSLGNLLFGGVKTIESVDVKGLVVDASGGMDSGGAADDSGDGAAGGSASPLKVLVKQAAVEAEILLADDRRIRATLTGANLGAGGDGTLRGDVLFIDSAPGAKIARMNGNATLGVVLGVDYAPEKFSLSGNLDASQPGQAPLPPLQIQAASGEERNSERPVTVSLETGGAKLLTVTASWSDVAGVSGQIAVNAARAQVAPYAFGMTLPEFNVQGTGQFAANPAKSTGSLKANLTASASELGNVQASLAALGAVQFTAQADAGWNGRNIEARQLALALSPAGGQPALTLDLIRPVTVETADGTIKIAGGASAELARLVLRAAPAAWLAAIAPAGYEVTGSSWSGQAVLGSSADGAIVAQTPQPFTLSGISVAQAPVGAAPRRALVSNATVALDVAASMKDGTVTAEVRRLVVTSAGATLVQLQAKISRGPGPDGEPRLATDGRAALDIDQLFRQPFAAERAANLPRGELLFDATFQASQAGGTAELSALQASIKLNEQALFNLQLAQKFTLPLAEGAQLPPVSGELLTLELNNLPIDFARPFLPASARISGDPARGKLVVAGMGGAAFSVELRATEPIVLPRFTYTRELPPDTTAGTLLRPVLSNVNITFTPQAHWSAQRAGANLHLQAAAQGGNILDATLEAARADGKLDATFAATGSLAALSQQPIGAGWRDFLPSPSPQFSLNASVSQDAQSTRITAAQAKVDTTGPSPVSLADVRLMQEFTLPAAPPDGKTAQWPKLSGDLLSLKLDNLPVGLLDMAVPGFRFQGEKISANFMVRGDGAGVYAVAANGPFAVSGLTLQKMLKDGKTEGIVSNLTASGRPVVRVAEAGLLSFSAPDLALSSGAATLAQGSLDIAFDPKPGDAGLSLLKFQLSGDVAQLMAQPVLQPFNNLTSGSAACAGEWSADGRFRLNAELTGLTVRNPERRVNSIRLTNATGTLSPDGAVQLTLPVAADGQNGATDCTVTFSLAAPGADPKASRAFSAQATGRGLVADDVMAAANTFRPPATGPQPAPAAATEPDTAPFWGNASGAAKVDLQRVYYSGLELGGVRSDVAVSPTRLTFANTTAQVSGGPFNIGAVLQFEAAQPRLPYAVQANLAVKNFNTVEYFRASAPDKVPPVAGNFTLDGTAAGRGANVRDLADKIQFDVKLASENGSFRLLDQVSPNARQQVNAARTVTGLGGLVAALGGQQQIAGGLQLAESLLGRLQVLNYKQLNFAAQRGSDLNVNITQFVLQDPELAIFGSGKLLYKPGLSLTAFPMQLTLRLDATGTPAQQLTSLGLMTQQKDSLGYFQGPPFQAGGTLGSPSYDGLFLLLFQTAAGGAMRAIGGGQ